MGTAKNQGGLVSTWTTFIGFIQYSLLFSSLLACSLSGQSAKVVWGKSYNRCAALIASRRYRRGGVARLGRRCRGVGGCALTAERGWIDRGGMCRGRCCSCMQGGRLMGNRVLFGVFLGIFASLAN